MRFKSTLIILLSCFTLNSFAQQKIALHHIYKQPAKIGINVIAYYEN